MGPIIAVFPKPEKRRHRKASFMRETESIAGEKRLTIKGKEDIVRLDRPYQLNFYRSHKREGKNMKPQTGNTTWQLQEAKAMLSEVVKSAGREAQIITVRGEEKAVVLSMDEYRKLTKAQKPTLFELFQSSPLLGMELELPERRIEPMRDINL
jgi:prevent-host-death family protein